MPVDVYKELCSRLLVPDSERLAKVWRMLCDETDAALLLAMPGTLPQLAQAAGIPEEDAQRRIADLFLKGVVFESAKPQGTIYKSPRHLIQMHDASVQWPDATPEYYEAWSDFMANEYPPLLSILLSAGIPAFMRVVPASGTVADVDGAMMHETVEKMVEAASEIAVVRCPCRLSEHKCDAPVETCIQFNNGAKYNIKRGTGRAISKEETMKIVKDCEERGLIHTVDNRAGIGNVLCNCCTDCCAIMRPYLKGEEFHPILAPSRFAARIDPEMCTMDELCVDICPVGAIALDEHLDSAVVDAARCIGCGLCAHECVAGAVTLATVRPPDFIPA